MCFARPFPHVDGEHQFIIRSLRQSPDHRRFCIAAKTQSDGSVGLQKEQCNFAKAHQRFFWWSSHTLVNLEFKKCLSVSPNKPKHNDLAVLSTCQRKLYTFSQYWVATRGYIISGWRIKDRNMGPLHKLVFDKSNKVDLTLTAGLCYDMIHS